jgi:serine/threonine protein kinase
MINRGTKIGKYSVIDCLNPTSRRITLISVDPTTNKKFVLKFITSKNPSIPFIRVDINLLNKLGSPYTMRYYDIIQFDNQRKFILMDYFEDGDLEKYFNMRKSSCKPFSESVLFSFHRVF